LLGEAVMEMLELDKFLNVKAKDLEGLSWYEIVSKLGLLSYNTAGDKPVSAIIRRAGISAKSRVLVSGCGSGGSAVHLAETTGAEVHGIDISRESINAADALAAKSPSAGRLHFQVADAHELPFEPESFDCVVTEFMAFFLKQSAFNGFYRALKRGGRIALAELMKDPDVDAEADAKILGAERMYTELLGYDFHIPLATDHIAHLKSAGFKNVEIAERFPRPRFRDQLEAVGGWGNLWKITRASLKLMMANTALRKKMVQMGKVKAVIARNAPTAKYIFQAIMMGRK
jgi:ubiquinone/menaquinone biosynthesis C-methylase UbiE